MNWSHLLIGVAIGAALGVLAAILIYSIFTKTTDVKTILSTVAPIAGGIVANQLLTEKLGVLSSNEIVVGAAGTFLVVLLWPVAIVMVRLGRDVGRAPPPKIRRSRRS